MCLTIEGRVAPGQWISRQSIKRLNLPWRKFATHLLRSRLDLRRRRLRAGPGKHGEPAIGRRPPDPFEGSVAKAREPGGREGDLGQEERDRGRHVVEGPQLEP